MPPAELDALTNALERLAAEVYAANAFVFDSWGLVWCRARGYHPHSEATFHAQVKSVLEGLSKPLHQGGGLDAMVVRLGPPLYCRSFAGIYALALWTTPSTVPFLMRQAIRRALPTIEALTIALPPPTGSAPNAGAQHGTA